jgi:hypothetical protein
MDARRQLASNLQSESKAYGYTLTIWGGGALLIKQFGTPDVWQVFLYVGGALAGFAALAMVAFDRPLSAAEADSSSGTIVVSTVHVVASGGNVALAAVLIWALSTAGVAAGAVFAVIGFEATVFYNLALLIERRVSRTLAELTHGVYGENETD